MNNLDVNIKGIKCDACDYRDDSVSYENYAEYVNRGTGLYGPFKQKIYPKNGKYLSFIYKGKRIAVPWTRGMKPRRFVEKSIESTERRIDEFLIRSAIETDNELGE